MDANVVTALSAVVGAGAVFLGQYVIAWRKGVSEDHATDRQADAQLEGHRDGLTLDLLNMAREEVAAFREEAKELRQYQARVAHLEEALDHVHALLHADSDEEWSAAERRARAFMRRMRPAAGDLRNMQQVEKSAGNDAIKGTDSFRVVPSNKKMSRVFRRRQKGNDDA